jgi:hypothetical protein
MKVTGSRTPKIREQERKSAKTLRVAEAVLAGVRGCSEDWDRRRTAATDDTDRKWTAGVELARGTVATSPVAP